MYKRQTNADNKTPLMGLGLAIVKKYVNAMNGEVSCNSVYGEGTKFTITFDEYMV
jgi:signal transduction histidine kinase